MPALKIQVGVGLAANPGAAFAPIIASAKKARAQVESELGGIGNRAQSVYRQSAREAETSANAQSKAAEKAAKNAERAWTQFFERQRRMRATMAAEEQAAAVKQGREIAANAGRFFGGGMRLAGRFGMDIARGAGLNVDVGSLVGKVVSNQALATRISGYGYVEGEQGAAGVRQNPTTILAEARAAANAAAMDTGDALEGLSRFVKKSSDLATGRALLADLAKYAKATGSDFGDVADAAGDIAKKLGDVPDKAEKVKSIMMVLAKQGKLGAIDMSDMATVISTMISPANRFAEGQAKAMVELGTALQIAKGYSKGPAQAATSVANFAADLTSKAGLKGLRGAGFKDEDIFADKGKTKVKSVEDIVVKALELTSGDLTKISATFSNKRSAAVLNAFNDIFSKAGGGAAGTAAIRGTFKQYGAGASPKDLQEQLSAQMGTTQSKVQLLNNRLEEIAESAAAKVLPALERFAPDLVTAADALAKLTVFVADNPFKAVGILAATSIAAALAKGALGEVAGKALGSAIAGMGGKGLSIAALTATAITAYLYMRKTFNEGGEGQSAAALRSATGGPGQLMRDVAAGRISKEDALKKLEETYATGTKDIRNVEKGVGYAEALNPFSDVTGAEAGRAQALRGGEGVAKIAGQSPVEALKSDLVNVKTAIDSLKAQMATDAQTTKKVVVTNMPATGAPVVDNANRTGP